MKSERKGESVTELLEVQKLSKVYPNGTRALSEVSFSVTPGEFAVIVGRSGAGKSTLMRCINRLAESTSGEVLLEGGSVTGLSNNDLRRARKKMGFVFQQFNLVKRISALQNVLCGRMVDMPVLTSCFRRFSKQERQVALECLERVGLGDKAAQRADTLSGGQQQRVAIARALAQRPSMILADEPVASLDPESAKVVMDTLRSLANEEGYAVLCNLHQVNLADRYADRILGIREGELVLDGKKGDLGSAEIESVYGAEAQEALR
ncbi:MAG: phosphonate ABC transporter ATP-binding protein [Rubrobacter sp.]|nr:phosphonate ABC transporter ATP-binding protein [Rubrobacter sp.]